MVSPANSSSNAEIAKAFANSTSQPVDAQRLKGLNRDRLGDIPQQTSQHFSSALTQPSKLDAMRLPAQHNGESWLQKLGEPSASVKEQVSSIRERSTTKGAPITKTLGDTFKQIQSTGQSTLAGISRLSQQVANNSILLASKLTDSLRRREPNQQDQILLTRLQNTDAQLELLLPRSNGTSISAREIA